MRERTKSGMFSGVLSGNKCGCDKIRSSVTGCYLGSIVLVVIHEQLDTGNKLLPVVAGSLRTLKVENVKFQNKTTPVHRADKIYGNISRCTVRK